MTINECWRRWSGAAVAALAAMSQPALAQLTDYRETAPTAAVATMLVTGSDPTRSVRIIFDPAKLPSDVSLTYRDTGASYFIAAALPDGSFHSFTPAGWRQVTPTTLLPSFTRPKGAYGFSEPQQRQVIVEIADLSALAGTTIYAGIGVGNRLTYTMVGSVLPSRPKVATVFPFASGAWRVTRTVDAFTDAVSCSLTAAPTTPDGAYLVRFGWEKASKKADIRLTMGLYGRTGSYIFGAHNGSQLRVDSWPAFELAAGTGAMYYTPPGNAPTEGPQQLHGNFEPNVSRMMGGQTLSIGYFSPALSTGYTVQAGLQGFTAAVDAFDACVLTQ